MKRKDVAIGIAIAVVILIATLVIHNFIFALPHVLVSSLIIFSGLLFTLCMVGGKKESKEKRQKTGGK